MRRYFWCTSQEIFCTGYHVSVIDCIKPLRKVIPSQINFRQSFNVFACTDKEFVASTREICTVCNVNYL